MKTFEPGAKIRVEFNAEVVGLGVTVISGGKHTLRS